MKKGLDKECKQITQRTINPPKKKTQEKYNWAQPLNLTRDLMQHGPAMSMNI